MKRTWWLWSAGAALLVLVLGVFWLATRAAAVRTADQAFALPQVSIERPHPGSQFPAGSSIVVAAAASGHARIDRLELWLDGTLLDARTAATEEDWGTLQAFVEIQVAEGSHLLVARAVDVNGLVGQSPPVAYTGGPPLADGAMLSVPADGVSSLDSLAASLGQDPEAVKAVNPGLPAVPPLGVNVKVPAPAESDSGSAPQMPNSPGGPPVPPMPAGPTLKNQPELGRIGGILADYSSVLPLDSQPPSAPGNLQAELDGCTVRLSWDDISENERSFEIWMAPLGLQARVVARLVPNAGTGRIHFEFAAPSTGIYAFYVSAVNTRGAQPSEMGWMSQPSIHCGEGPATQLGIEALSMQVGASYDRAYCYLSPEGLAERRIPADPGEFFDLVAGSADLTIYPSRGSRLLIPVPADESLTISGECWGWSGGQLLQVGDFQVDNPLDEWDGRSLVLGEGDFSVTYRILPVGSLGAGTSQLYSAPAIIPPYELKDELAEDDLTSFLYDPRDRILSWKWDGNPQDITGFTVYLNDAPVAQVAPDQRSAYVRIPTWCGGNVSWQVEPIGKTATGLRTAPYSYEQQECPVTIEVQIQTVHVGEARDHDFPVSFSPCDEMETHFWARLESSAYTYTQKNYWGGNFFMPMSCGEFSFKDLAGNQGGPDPDIFQLGLVPPRGGDENSIVPVKLVIVFKDYDSLSPDDLFLSMVWDLAQPLKDWVGFDQTFTEFASASDGFGSIDFRVRGWREK